MHIKSAILATVLGLGMVSAFPAVAQQDGANGLGEQSYMTYCSTCHGKTAEGDGAFGDLLTVAIPGLTQLSADNHGEFPMLRVIQTIDGRTGMRAHDAPMPVYGDIFFSEDYGPYGAEAIVRGQMLAIALYLESIQQ